MLDVVQITPELVTPENKQRIREVLVDMAKRMWRKMDQIGDESLLDTHYTTLRTAPIGPLSRNE